MNKIILAQFVVLLVGTIFAWYNFVKEYAAWANNYACVSGCASGLTNPFLAPCFYGAVFFTIAIALNIFLLLSKKILINGQ